jgi:hypothetical protein
MKTLTATLECNRVRKGQPVTEKIAVDYRDDLDGLPELIIHSAFRPTQGLYREIDSYRVEEIPTWDNARAFLLHRSPEAIAADPDHVERYGVLVEGPESHRCECKGFERTGRACKHIEAMKFILGNRHIVIDEPAQVLTEAPF